jgi:hypothetical protein
VSITLAAEYLEEGEIERREDREKNRDISVYDAESVMCFRQHQGAARQSPFI